MPIHVAGDEDYDEDELEENEVIINETVQDEVSTDVVVSDVTEAAEVSTPVSVSSTIAPIQQDVLDETTAEPEVTGQVVRYPCSCIEGQCGCCTGTVLQTMNMKACGNVSFIPEDFVFDVRLSVNNQTMIRRRVSGK